MEKSQCARTGWPSSWTGPLKALSGVRVVRVARGAAAATACLCCVKWDALAAKACNLQSPCHNSFCFCLLHVDDGRGWPLAGNIFIIGRTSRTPIQTIYCLIALILLTSHQVSTTAGALHVSFRSRHVEINYPKIHVRILLKMQKLRLAVQMV